MSDPTPITMSRSIQAEIKEVDMPADVPQSGTRLELSLEKATLGHLSFIRQEMTETMKEISKVADRGSSILLLTLGASILIFDFLFKLRPFGVQVSELSSAEFISAMLVAMVLLLAGSGIKVYQFRTEQEVGRMVRESGIALVSKGMDAGTALAKGPNVKKKEAI